MTYRRNNDRIILTPIEQRYIATCYPFPDRPFLDEANEWKERLKETSLKNQDIEVTINDIGRAFPHIGMLYRKGFFDKRSIRSYFEDIDQESHNMRMYLFAKSVARKHLPEHILLDVLYHIEHCSVKVADLNSSTVWSYGMIYQSPIDMKYFNLSSDNNRVLVHGKNENDIIGIRDISEDEFEKYRLWFEERQSSSRNPFVRFREKLEYLL